MSLHPRPGHLLALDFGGTKLSAGVIAIDQAKTWEKLERIPTGSHARHSLERMLDLASALLGGRTPAAVGISFGGPVDYENGIVLRCYQTPGWENFPLKDKLQARFSAPAALENDANAAALGEWSFGAGRGCRSLLYVTVSTGVGGGWVLDGRIFRGANGLAGEIGHLPMQPDGPPCTCGKRGCLEALASGPAIARAARRRLADEPASGSILRNLVNRDLAIITAEHVAGAAEAGDMLARQVLSDAARYLGQAIATAILLMNPERVILGGGVAKSGLKFWQALHQAISSHVMPGMVVEILPASLGDDAPLCGAAALAKILLA